MPNFAPSPYTTFGAITGEPFDLRMDTQIVPASATTATITISSGIVQWKGTGSASGMFYLAPPDYDGQFYYISGSYLGIGGVIIVSFRTLAGSSWSNPGLGGNLYQVTGAGASLILFSLSGGWHVAGAFGTFTSF